MEAADMSIAGGERYERWSLVDPLGMRDGTVTGYFLEFPPVHGGYTRERRRPERAKEAIAGGNGGVGCVVGRGVVPLDSFGYAGAIEVILLIVGVRRKESADHGFIGDMGDCYGG